MPRNRFLAPRTHPLRIAVSCTARFPDPEQLHVYDEFAAFHDVLDAEIVVPHSQVSTDTKVPAHVAWLEGCGLFLRPIEEVFRADFAHFQRTMPDRVDAMLRTLAPAIGCTVEALHDRWELLSACTYTRYLQALDVDYIHTWYNYDQSFHAAVASLLLGIPRGITLCDGFDADDWDLKIPQHHLATADVIIAVSDDTQALVEKLGGPDAASRCVRTGGTEAVNHIVDRVRAAIDRADRVPGGVDAAFWENKERTRDTSADTVPYVLVATERTGSNLLFEVLALESGNELFNPDYKADGFVPFFDEKFHRNPNLIRMRDEDPPALLDRCWEIGANHGFPAMGFKLMYYHGCVEQQVVDYLRASTDIKVLHSKRRNRLSRFLSNRRAQISGSWYKTKRMKGEGGPKQAIELDPEEMLIDFHDQEILEERFDALFQHHDVSTFEYEVFSADFDGTRAQAEEFLGVKLPVAPVRTRKTGKRTMRDGIANYDAVAAALSGTRWAEFLEE